MAETSDRPPLYAFTGINGAGKTTLISGVAQILQAEGKQVFVSKAYSDEMKELSEPLLRDADDTETMFIFQALQRRQRNLALGRLSLGQIVLADRWSESYEAYHSQFGILAKNEDLRNSINNLAVEGLVPRLTFYLNIDVPTALSRSKHRKSDVFDAEAREYEYQSRHAEFYDSVSSNNPNWVVLDAGESPESLVEKTVGIINSTGG